MLIPPGFNDAAPHHLGTGLYDPLAAQGCERAAHTRVCPWELASPAARDGLGPDPPLLPQRLRVRHPGFKQEQDGELPEQHLTGQVWGVDRGGTEQDLNAMVENHHGLLLRHAHRQRAHAGQGRQGGGCQRLSQQQR